MVIPSCVCAALFVVVTNLQFSIACLVGILFSASALVLSLDRSVGGRLFGGIVFIGTVCTGASIGEAARQVVLGYCWVAFACTAANILAGTLLYVRSAHDDFRRGCAALFRGAGTQISRCVRGRSRLCVWSAASIQRLHSKGSFLYLKCT